MNQSIVAFMEKQDKNLRSDRDFKYYVEIKHLDESYFELTCAYVEEDEKYLYVWTEHTGYFYFAKEDLEDFSYEVLTDEISGE